MKIVNCALLYADGDKYVWSVVTEGASEFPIDMELVADGSIWENDGEKSVLTDGSWVKEESGGSVSFPTYTMIVNPSTAKVTWKCDMTYTDVSAVYDREALGERYTDCPCKFQNRDGTAWQKMQYWTKQDLEDYGFPLDPALPSTVVGGFLIMTMMGQNVNYPGLYADDGNFYTVTSQPS